MTKRIDTRRGSQPLPAVLAAVLMLSGAGCASLQLLNLKSDKIAMADAEHPAIEVLAIWQAAEGPGLGGIPTRGFAGQIFFFTQDRAQPVAVDGKARIYVFDDHGTPDQQARPLRQFDFDRQSWAAHLQNSKLGPTYGVFIPYPRDDYHQAVCSLRVKFIQAKGRPLYSASSTLVLPGPPITAATETTQKSPLDELAKKLQAQQGPHSWTNASLNTEPRPLNGGPQPQAAQFPAAQMPAGIAQLPAAGQVQTAAAYSPAAGAPNGYAPAGYGPGAYATNPSQVGARVNPIVQTSGLAGMSEGAPLVVSPETAAYLAGGTADLPQPSGRIKLQAVTSGNPSSAADEIGNADDSISAGGASSPPMARSKHPLLSND